MDPDLIEVPPTTVAIDKVILDYMEEADMWTHLALLDNGGHPLLYPDGSVHGDFCHSVAAARLMGLPCVRVYVEAGIGS